MKGVLEGEKEKEEGKKDRAEAHKKDETEKKVQERAI